MSAVRSGICPVGVHVWLEMLASGVSAVASILALRVHAGGQTVLADSSRHEWPLCRAFSAGGARPGCGLAVLQEYGPSCCLACSVPAGFFAMLHVAGVCLPPLRTRPCSHPSGVTSILYIAIHSRWHIPTCLCPSTVGVARTEGGGSCFSSPLHSVVWISRGRQSSLLQ